MADLKRDLEEYELDTSGTQSLTTEATDAVLEAGDDPGHAMFETPCGFNDLGKMLYN